MGQMITMEWAGLMPLPQVVSADQLADKWLRDIHFMRDGRVPVADFKEWLASTSFMKKSKC